MGGMPDIAASGDGRGQAADRQDPPSGRELGEERVGGAYFFTGRTPVGALRPGMSRDDVPAERLDLELRKRPADDRGGCLRGPLAGELPLRGEGDARDARAAIAGCLTDEEQRAARVHFEVLAEPRPAQVRGATLPVEIERCADPC